MAKDKTKSSTHTSSLLAQTDAFIWAEGLVLRGKRTSEGFMVNANYSKTSFFALVRIARAIASPTSAILANR